MKPQPQATRVPGWVPVAGAVGLLGLLATLAVQRDLPRFFANWVMWLVILLSMGLGALFTVALEHVVAARWSVPLRRVPERLSSILGLVVPVALIGLLSLVMQPSLYPWAAPEARSDAILAGKAVWLNPGFFSLRVLLCFVLWGIFYLALVKGSIRQDEGRNAGFAAHARRNSVLFLLVYAPTITLVAFDWVMSLEPKWHSTIFGVYLFSGSLLSGLAAITLGVLHLKRAGRLPGVGPDHLYNLGGLMFAFTCFWTFIAISQFLLMWYANLPEEVIWFVHRSQHGWWAVALLLALAHFIVPFFALLSRDAKSDEARLSWVSMWILGAHALDIYFLVMPSLGRGILVGAMEIFAALFFIAAATGWAARSMRLGADMPTGDPNLSAGLEFHL